MKGRISINRYTSNHEPNRGISITLDDNSLGVRFLEATMSIEDFGNAITGLGSVDCEFELHGLDAVGKTAEHKEVCIPVKEFPGRISDAEIAEMLKPYEIDGWMGYRRDINNHHRYDSKGKTVRVSFFRYV